ncbi:sterol uptake control 2 [Fusarium pseudoanthophilum]|uniref:Sterol uptake control 2 n=1 Tax=Fusarium pseudoanthophilum TaxID=48495 RepID=A0A8H5PG78_9HYPO|nr:sterol uptake control 2 [Fusarium pseudoanthophilum]
MRKSTTPQPTGPESISSARVSKLARRPHRKSRNGCFNCKRRKCDEVKPACANCVRFGIPCDFAPQPPSSDDSAPHTSPPEILSVLAEPATTPRRGPGRPRKDWAALTRPPPPPPPASDRTTTSPSSTSATPVSSSTISNSQICSLNIADAELLFHFMANTSRTLHDADDPVDDIASFWARNVPQIGLSYHFVLHMMYALAGYHLVYQEPKGTERHSQSLALAAHHAELGIYEMNRTLTNLNEANCGALYVAAVLVCYCTFAAGPTGPDDLLVCVIGEGISQRWLPVIHGVRLIRQSIEPATLFTGLMAPLGGGGTNSEMEDAKPDFMVMGFSYIDWVGPLEKLRLWIASHENPDTALYLRVHKSLCDVYEANFGNAEGLVQVPKMNKFVFGWLYRMQDLFVGCLQRKAPQALLLMAYYVPLFRTMKRSWFMEGWATHLLETIRGLLSPDLIEWNMMNKLDLERSAVAIDDDLTNAVSEIPVVM